MISGIGPLHTDMSPTVTVMSPIARKCAIIYKVKSERMVGIFMVKSIKKSVILVMGLIFMFAAVACSSEVASRVDKNADTAEITAEWDYDHAIQGGENVARYTTDKDEDLPHFTSDGQTFTFNIVPENVYTGTVTVNEDGSYKLTKGESADGPSITAIIEGNSLTVQVNEDNAVIFVVKE